MAHAYGEIGVGGFDQKMIVIAHEAVSVTDPVIPTVNVLQGVEKIDAVLVGSEDGLLLVPAGSDMIDSTGIFDTERARHEKTIQSSGAK